jgi:hypothetical protein
MKTITLLGTAHVFDVRKKNKGFCGKEEARYSICRAL